MNKTKKEIPHAYPISFVLSSWRVTWTYLLLLLEEVERLLLVLVVCVCMRVSCCVLYFVLFVRVHTRRHTMLSSLK